MTGVGAGFSREKQAIKTVRGGNGSVTSGRGQVGSPRRGDRPGKNRQRTARRAVPTSMTDALRVAE